MITTETRLTAQLHDFAAARGVRFTDPQAAEIVAIRVRVDVEREQVHAIVVAPPKAPIVERGTITAVGVVELTGPDGPYLLMRIGDEAWLVPDMPDGWVWRERWTGDINSVRWIGGPPAIAAFRRVGAPL